MEVKQGVLLLNSILTVRENKASSHQNKGWEKFTDNIISAHLLKRRKTLYFYCGENLHKRKKNLSTHKHHILISSHPSPHRYT